MTNILLVDDDPLVLKIYRDALTQLGAQVRTAEEGLAAIRALHQRKPDLMVLDLMMPKLSGVDVLKFVRSEPLLRSLPVIVLSNSYMNELAAEAARLGVQKALLKIRCSPSILLKTIDDVLSGKAGSGDTSVLLAAPVSTPPAPSPTANQIGPAQAVMESPRASTPPSPTEFQAQARRSFLNSSRTTCATLRTLFQAYTGAPNPSDREQRLAEQDRDHQPGCERALLHSSLSTYPWPRMVCINGLDSFASLRRRPEI